VTPLTPTKAPTQIVITSAAQTVTLALTKLNQKSLGCAITGPMTINGVPYTYFSASSVGPKLPETGGTLAISFPVRNFGAAALTTSIQPMAFLSRRNVPSLAGFRSIKLAAPKSYTLAANSTTTVTMNVPVPAAWMAATPATISGLWGFNVGIQSVDTNSVANCLDLTTFPVLHNSLPAAAAANAPDEVQPTTVIPLRIGEDARSVLEWGEIPTADNGAKH
jgi:hypothetical protein